MKYTKAFIINNIDELIEELQRIKAETPSITLGYENPVSGTGLNFDIGYQVVTTTYITETNVEQPCVFIK